MIEIRNLSLPLGDFSLKDINLTIGDGEYFVILGPTGAGKTVIVECVAGLQRFKKGEIWIGGENVTVMAPEERGIGYVPQDYALFPFLNVVENITFGLKEKRCPEKDMRETVGKLSELLGISHLLNRGVTNLSGGEKQRVALARALATSPRILLLDEPLSNLDISTSKYLRLELRRLHEELGITTVHITHNLVEAEEMADRICILSEGKVEQVGALKDVFFSPRNDVVSDFVGKPNILNCDACNPLGHGLMEASCGGMSVILPYEGNDVKKISIFPRYVFLYPGKPPGPELNRFKGIVKSIQPFYSLVRLEVKVGENLLLCEVRKERFEDMDIKIGQEVFLILKLTKLKVYH